MAVVLVHGVMLATTLYGIWYDYHFVELPPHMRPSMDVPIWKGRVKFLTMWNLVHILFWIDRGRSMFYMKRNIYYKMLYSVFLVLVLCIYFYGLYYDWVNVNISVENRPIIITDGIGGRWRFLTYWNLALQTVYFSVALLNDIVGSNENVPSKVPFIRKLKDYMFSSLAFPIAMYVGVTFWGLMAVDRELVFPKALDAFFPNWLNHLMHTNIMVFILLEMFLTFRKYPSKKRGLSGLTVFLVAYLGWMHVIYFYSGMWVYPILEVLNWPMKLMFYAASVVMGVVLYLLGEFLNNTLWSKQMMLLKKPSKKKGY